MQGVFSCPSISYYHTHIWVGWWMPPQIFDKKTKRKFDSVMSGQFCTIAVFREEIMIIMIITRSWKSNHSQTAWELSFDEDMKNVVGSGFLINIWFQEVGENPANPWTYYEGQCMTSTQFCQRFGYTYTSVSLMITVMQILQLIITNLPLTILQIQSSCVTKWSNFQGEQCEISASGMVKTFSELSKRVSPAEDFYNRCTAWVMTLTMMVE